MTRASVREVLRWEGWRGVFVHAVRKACRPVIQVQRWIFFEHDLIRQPPTGQTARVPLEIRTAGLEDVEMFAEALRAAGTVPEEARRRLERGDVAILALSGGRLAHVRWIAYSSPIWINEIGVNLVLNAGEAYVYNAVTLPEWRGQGISDVISSFTAPYSRSRGLTRHVYYVRAGNVQGLKAPLRLGRTRTKTVWSIRVTGMKRPLLFGVTRAGSPSLALPS